MATLLWVENAKPFMLDWLLPRAGEALRFILGVTYAPELVGVQTWKPEVPLPEPHYIELNSASFGIKINGENAMVSVVPSKKHGAMCVSPDGWRSKLEYALAAAVVIAIGEYSESDITDPGWAYIRAPKSLTAKEFADSIKAEETFNDINEAAQVFSSRLPLSPKQN